MKTAPALLGLLGLSFIVALVAHEGYIEILKLLEVAGWGLLWLIPFHILPLLLDVEGWRVLLVPRDPQGHATRPFLFWIATVREAVSRLLPVASVGGEIVGIRLALLRPLDGTAVIASVTIEILLTLVSQYLFTILGLGLLLGAGSAHFAGMLLLGLLATLPVLVLVFALLRYGSLFSRVERVLIGMLGERTGAAGLFGNATRLDTDIRALLARKSRLVLSLLWQLAGMIVGAFETWLALRLLGHGVTLGTATALESLTLAIRHFAFFVPGTLGVQEAGLVMFGSLAGLPAEVSVALSLAKRLRELGFSLPALLSWQCAESLRLRRVLWRDRPASTEATTTNTP